MGQRLKSINLNLVKAHDIKVGLLKNKYLMKYKDTNVMHLFFTMDLFMDKVLLIIRCIVYWWDVYGL